MAAEHQGLHLSRRRFVQGAGVAGVGLLAACGRPQALAPPASPPRIGVLSSEGAPLGHEAFRAGLRDLGYVEGQNIVIEWRLYVDRDSGNLDTMAAELVGLPVEVIAPTSTLAALAARRATSNIPIVFTGVSDPIGSGLVASLARPGGNVTGLSDFGATLSGKRLELLRDAVPGATRVGFVGGGKNPGNALIWRETQAAAPTLGVQLSLLDGRDDDTLEGALEAAVRERVDAVIMLGSPETAARAGALTVELQLPALFEQATAVPAGGLMAYGPRRPDLRRRAAYYVDRILKGAQPSDLPVEQPTTFEFVVNLKTAQALGLTIPPHVLLQATEVIQ
jgi:putative tryptophan/tyrosine transport system substrate-binding protein